MKKLTIAESDAVVESLNDAADRLLGVIKRIEADTGLPLGNATNGIRDAIANARIRVRAYTEKETEN